MNRCSVHHVNRKREVDYEQVLKEETLTTGERKVI